MEKIVYSVVCPVYNYKKDGEGVLHNCLESVRNFSSNYELIVVDDASPVPLEIDADIFVKHKTNKGLAPTWNDGIKLARGKYIVLINSDIEVCDGWLEGMKDKFDNGVGVSAPAVEHLPNDPTQPPYQWFPGSCFMLSKDTLKKVGLFDERFVPFYFEDTDFWTRILRAGLKMARAYGVFVKHKESFTVKDLSSDEKYKANYQKFLDKWGFDPIPIFCGGLPYGNFI